MGEHIHNLGENYDEFFGLDEYDAYDPFGEEPITDIDINEEIETMEHTDEIAILMSDYHTKAEAEKLLKNGTIVYENPADFIQSLKDCDCYEGETVEQARKGEYADISVVIYKGHEYLIEYVH